MDEAVIQTHRLVKHYGPVKAVDGIDLTIRRGEIYGFLGRNGAGKTTTIRMLLGLIRPSEGEVILLGTRMGPGQQAVLGRVGTLVESAAAYPNLTVRENLDIHRRLTGAPQQAVDKAMTLLHLENYSQRQAGQLSLGNKQRLSLARALLHEPELLILDEPANGLDPAGIVEIRGLLQRLAQEQGVTIFMSSHILTEVAHLADRIGIVHEGRLLEEMDVEDMVKKSGQVLEIKVSQPARAKSLLSNRLGLEHMEITPDQELRLPEAAGRAADIAKVLVESGLELTKLCEKQEDLEAHFLRLTGGAQ